MGAKIAYSAFKALKKLIEILPRRCNYYFAKLLGSILYYLIVPRRKLAIKNLKLSLGLSDKKAKNLTKGIFKDVVIKFVETMILEQWTNEDFSNRVKVEGIKNLENAYKQEKGVVLFTGHIGNWEILGIYLSWLGYPVNAIARMYQNSMINDEVLRIRQSKGAKVFSKKGKGVRKAFKALLKKELLLILGDQDAHSKGVFIEFLNRPASTPNGPVTLAQKTGAAIIPIYLLREKLNYRLIVERPIGVAKDASKDEINTVLKKINSSLEEKIKEYPEQWLWLHQRLKTKIKEAL